MRSQLVVQLALCGEALAMALTKREAPDPADFFKAIEPSKVDKHIDNLVRISGNKPPYRFFGSDAHEEFNEYIEKELSIAGLKVLSSKDDTFDIYYCEDQQDAATALSKADTAKTDLAKAAAEAEAERKAEPLASLEVEGEKVDVFFMGYAPGDTITEPLKHIKDPCEKTSWPKSKSSDDRYIGLAMRGIPKTACSYSDMMAYAVDAGAAGVIYYNNNKRPAGDQPVGSVMKWQGLGMPMGSQKYVPAATMSWADGSALAQKVEAAAAAAAGGKKTVEARLETRCRTGGKQKTSRNVIVETEAGPADSVVLVGAHSDSVADGPGINDNGSGVVALIEAAKLLAPHRGLANKVRFAFWTGEEPGLVGSRHYVQSLEGAGAGSAAAKRAVRLYANFDTLATSDDKPFQPLVLTPPPGADKNAGDPRNTNAQPLRDALEKMAGIELDPAAGGRHEKAVRAHIDAWSFMTHHFNTVAYEDDADNNPHINSDQDTVEHMDKDSLYLGVRVAAYSIAAWSMEHKFYSKHLN